MFMIIPNIELKCYMSLKNHFYKKVLSFMGKANFYFHKKKFRSRNSRTERGRQSRQNTICASAHPAQRVFYCIGNPEEFPIQ